MSHAHKRATSGTTFHLTPVAVWRAHERQAEYRPEEFANEGFIHCTNGEPLVIEVGNRFYQDDPRPYVVLDVDLSRVSASVIYEDEAREYPHIYGAIGRGAVSRVRRVDRAVDGAFVAIGQPIADPIP